MLTARTHALKVALRAAVFLLILGACTSTARAQCPGRIDSGGNRAGVRLDHRGTIRVKLIEVERLTNPGSKFTLLTEPHNPKWELEPNQLGNDHEHKFKGPIKLFVCSTTPPNRTGSCASTPSYENGHAEFTVPGGQFRAKFEITCL